MPSSIVEPFPLPVVSRQKVKGLLLWIDLAALTSRLQLTSRLVGVSQ
jgi:hypothetical protein